MMKPLPNLSYNYENTTYSLNPFQQEIHDKIKSLPQKRLHYLVGQQSSDPDRLNLTLKELKYLIRRGIMKYIRQTSLPYHKGQENELVKFYCVFETDLNFNRSQNSHHLMSSSFFMGLHFHLFFSSPDHYPWISFESLIHYIFMELTSIPKKKMCLSQYDYKRVKTLEDPFILYHTKQFYERPSKEMILTNL